MTARRWLDLLVDRLSERRSLALVLVAAVSLLAGGLVAVTLEGDEGVAPGTARLRPDGEVEVAIDGERFVAATSEMTLSQGDEVQVLDGAALLELPRGARTELRDGSHVRIGGSEGAGLALEAGELLVEVERGTTEIDGGSALVAVGAGASRLRRSASLVAGVYEGTLLLAGTGQSLSVPRFRQAAVAGVGRIPDVGGLRPLDLDEDDEWDRRFLGSVLELDRRLLAFARGFEAVLPQAEATSPSLYQRVLPELAGTPLRPAMLEARSAGENLIGLSIVALADGSFEDAFERVFDLRRLGARWGLVAADEGFDSPRLVGAVEQAVDRAPLDIAAPGEVEEDESFAAPPPDDSGGGGSTTSTTQGPSDTTTTTSAPGPGPTSTTTTTSPVPTLPSSSTTTTTTSPSPSPTTTTTTPDDCGLLDGILGGCA